MSFNFNVIESWESDADASSDASGKGDSEVSRHFNVTASIGGARSYDVLRAQGIPRLRDSYPLNFYYVARKRSVNQKSPLYFEVTIGYDSKIADPDENENPLDEPAKISYRTINTAEPVSEDIDGNPIATVNGEPIDGVQMPIADLAMTIRRNLPTFNPVSIFGFVNTVNNTAFWNFPAGTVKMVDISAENVFSTEFEYWDVSVDFEMRKPIRTIAERAWWARVAHAGLLVKDRNSGEQMPAWVAGTNENATRPVFINPSGYQETDSTVGHWLEFQLMEESDFNTLNLL